MNKNTKRLVRSELWLAAMMVTVGLAIAGLSLARLHARSGGTVGGQAGPSQSEVE